ncbi:hypothetical protein BDQ17DRAFT_1336320 [Cyathus striatus]|nr:hypothetical protein BDQ17DRAFT_1336320 [Cyathus striatus]
MKLAASLASVVLLLLILQPNHQQRSRPKPTNHYNNEETENVQEKQGKKIVKAKKAKKTCAERVLEESGLPVAPPKRGPSSDVPQPAALFSLLLLKKNTNQMDMKPIMKVKIKKILKVQLMDQMQVMEMNQNTVMSDKKYTEDHTSKNKGSDISIVSSKSNSNRTKTGLVKIKSPVSPPRTTSGILRGNALGNHPNAATFTVLLKALLSKYCYGTWSPSFTLKHNLMATIGPVLKKLKDRAEHFFTADRCLFQPNAPLSLDIEMYSIQSKSAGSSATNSRAISRSHTPSLVQRGGISEQHTEELIDVLKIPRDILESTAPGLRVAYQRYLACINTVSDHNTMDKNRTWPVAKTTKKEIITVFVSSSAWYENNSNFDKIADFPAMQSWLAEDEDSPTDLDLWGFERDYYMFLDLKRWLKEKKEKRKGKGKGKGKSKEEKAHEDKEKSSSKKCNWMVTFETYL